MKIEYFKYKVKMLFILFISIFSYIDVKADLGIYEKNSCILYNGACYSSCIKNHSNILTFMNGSCEQNCCIIENTNSNLIKIIIFLFFIILVIYLVKIKNKNNKKL